MLKHSEIQAICWKIHLQRPTSYWGRPICFLVFWLYYFPPDTKLDIESISSDTVGFPYSNCNFLLLCICSYQLKLKLQGMYYGFLCKAMATLQNYWKAKLDLCMIFLCHRAQIFFLHYFYIYLISSIFIIGNVCDFWNILKFKKVFIWAESFILVCFGVIIFFYH